MKLAIAFIASTLSLTTLAAHASTPSEEVQSVTVQFADLDLDREAGMAALYLRIKSAARRVCDQLSYAQPGEIYPVCVNRAASEAIARINRPMMSEYFEQRSGKPVKTAPISVAAR